MRNGEFVGRRHCVPTYLLYIETSLGDEQKRFLFDGYIRTLDLHESQWQ